LAPSTGQDIIDDLTHLFQFITTLPISLHQLFLSGYSGGGYPLRLAGVLAAEEAKKSNPAYTVLGLVSYFGMTGDSFLDYWLTPRGTSGQELDFSRLEEIQKELAKGYEGFMQGGEEYSDAPYTAELSGHTPTRGIIWDYWHVTGSINDSISGKAGLSKMLVDLPHDKRQDAIPVELQGVFPQIYFKKNAKDIPPMLLIHGDADQAVPYEESVAAFKDLQAGGGNVELKTIKGANHNLEVGGVHPEETYEVYRYTVEWMLKRVEEAKK
jgi:acetyl esterase/lipase